MSLWSKCTSHNVRAVPFLQLSVDWELTIVDRCPCKEVWSVSLHTDQAQCDDLPQLHLVGKISVCCPMWHNSCTAASQRVVLQDIKFPMSLDVFDLCTPELQQRLMPARDKFKAEEDKRVEVAQMVKSNILLHLTLTVTALCRRSLTVDNTICYFTSE